MQITIAAPVRPGATSGNDVTAQRWARRLAELGHEVSVVPVPPQRGEGFVVGDDDVDVGHGADVLVVLHARRCARVVAVARALAPSRPVVVGLAGTDLYGDLPDDADTRAAVDAADALVVLQERALNRLGGFDPAWAAKASVVHQSVEPPLPARRPDPDRFTIVVLAHLRDVKDPLLAARAARRLPAASTAIVVHAGAAHDDAWADAAREEAAQNPRYRWLGELDRPEALDLLARAHVLACTSALEGGANVVSEAIALGVPVIGTAIDGNIGLLGDDHPDLVAVGDEVGLAAVIDRLESDPTARAAAEARILDRQSLVALSSERDRWREVLARLR